MAWDWLSFVAGVLVGLALMWIAVVAAAARAADNEEHFR